MKQFTLPLDEKSMRPIIRLNNWNRVRALLDTGAFFPIWTASEQALEALGGELVLSGVSFGGFGGKANGNLYKLKMLTVGELIFPNIHIIACKDMGDVPFQVILSATMFQKLIYEIDDKNHKLNVTVPSDESVVRNLVIQRSDGRLQVCCISGSADGQLSMLDEAIDDMEQGRVQNIDEAWEEIDAV